ncbi:hypothetical protein NNJEOMEG_00043 [Fundidesulfovibrio magnetotacticus]|uniref:Uncharacterized protein n=1 Tax=Fundidesulfovibrio magnetotacticus TaxID=2730080 RepID=A0A6V8LNY6_9BACT|nr:hypothetical protein [Fundidesulfovibrio magnetotacticus]GFK92221.1 hypothetical protein NNJEOMEG_00043 [Fundidesulfovibrio magnetotacticus]
MAENDSNPQNQDDKGISGSAPDKGEQMIPKSRFDAVNNAKKQAEETLAGLVQELVEDIPEQFRSLVPSIAPAEQIKWIRSAQKTGLFTQKADASGPDSKRPGGKQPTNYNDMSATQKMAHGYSK